VGGIAATQTAGLLRCAISLTRNDRKIRGWQGQAPWPQFSGTQDVGIAQIVKIGLDLS
jgi:hypothetical protein